VPVDAVHVPDRDGQAGGARALDERGGLLRVGERPGRDRDGDVRPTLVPAELGLDLSAAGRRTDEVDVSVEVEPRAVRQHGADAELEGGFDWPQLPNVVELHAGRRGRAGGRGHESRDQQRPARGREALLADEEYDAAPSSFRAAEDAQRRLE